MLLWSQLLMGEIYWGLLLLDAGESIDAGYRILCCWEDLESLGRDL